MNGCRHVSVTKDEGNMANLKREGDKSRRRNISIVEQSKGARE